MRARREAADGSVARLAYFRRSLGMLVVATRLGSLARAALTLLTFLAVWLVLSIPDAFGATVVRSSSFTYDANSGLLLTETVEPGDAQLGVKTTYAYDAFGNKLSATTENLAGASGNAVIASRTTSATFEGNGRFALTTTNRLGHSESAVTEAKFGVTTSQQVAPGATKGEASRGATEADIAGCYVAPLGDGSDKICILPPSRFEQEFTLSDSTPVNYYSGRMRVFSYKRDGHLAVAATLVNFTVVNERGAVVAARTIDIQPFENMFGQMMFLVGSDVAGHERLYKREN